MAKSKRTRIKAPALPVVPPANQAQAADMVARMGAIGRDVVVLNAALDEEIAVIKASVKQQAQPLLAELEALRAGLQVWAEANRAQLTRDGRTKTVKLTTGELQWRHRPASVRISGEDALLELLEKSGPELFLRRKVEIDREAMLAHPEAARTLPGVIIASAGEEFIVTPDEANEVAA